MARKGLEARQEHEANAHIVHRQEAENSLGALFLFQSKREALKVVLPTFRVGFLQPHPDQETPLSQMCLGACFLGDARACQIDRISYCTIL